VLKDPDPHLRANAAWTLGEIGGEEAITLLKAALRDEASSVKMHAVWALDRLIRSPAKTPAAKASASARPEPGRRAREKYSGYQDRRPA